jgi:sensor histidine kinase regulating citrate/malate metabolism
MMDNTETTPARLADPNEHPRRKIRFDPTINAGHIGSALFSVISTIVMVMAVYSNFDKRVTIQEERQVNQVARDAAQDAAMKEKFNEVKESIKDLTAAMNEMRRDLRKTP